MNRLFGLGKVRGVFDFETLTWLSDRPKAELPQAGAFMGSAGAAKTSECPGQLFPTGLLLRIDEAQYNCLPEPINAIGRKPAPTVPQLAMIVTVRVSPTGTVLRGEIVGDGAVGGVGGGLAVVSS